MIPSRTRKQVEDDLAEIENQFHESLINLVYPSDPLQCRERTQQMAIEIVELDNTILDHMILTNFYYPDSKARSVWRDGDWMKHSDWCQEEAKAFRERGRNVSIVRDEQGRLALFDKGNK